MFLNKLIISLYALVMDLLTTEINFKPTALAL